MELQKSDKSAMAINELRQRVDQRLREISVGAVEAALSVGLERNYIRDLVEGKKETFAQSKTERVAQALRWSVSDLYPGVTLKLPPPAKIQSVPLMDTVSAGKLTAPMSQLPVEEVPLLAFADLGRGEFIALTVKGDSMDRLSPEGSKIVVNKADRTLVAGRSYVFCIRGDVTFKQWRPDPPRLQPFSTNPIHDPVYVKSKSEAEKMVVGRVKRTVLDL